MTSGIKSRTDITGLTRTANALESAMIMAILPTSEGWNVRSEPQLKKAVMPPRPASMPSTMTSRAMLTI